MKIKILTLLFLAVAQFSFAQKEPIISYEWLEKQSEIISDLQIKVTGLKEQGFDVTFSKDNFKVFYHDKLASWSCNLGTFLVLIEDIDFSKVTGITAVDNQVVVIFPENLTIQVYGEQTSTTKHNTLDFYTNSVEDRQKMFTTLYELIAFLKMDKGLMKTNGDWEKHGQEYQKLKPYEFYQKYPNSILAYKGKLLEEDYDRQVKFINSFAQRYNVPNLGKIEVKELKLKIPETKKVFKRRRLYHQQAILKPKDLIDKNPVFVSYVVAYNWKEYRAGSIRDDFDEANIVSGIGYTIAITQNKEEAMEKYNSILKELSSNINNNLATVSKNQNTFILKFNKKIPYESIHLNFLEHNVGKSKWYEVNLLFNPNNYWSKLWE